MTSKPATAGQADAPGPQRRGPARGLDLLAGLVVAGAVAAAAIGLARLDWLRTHGISALVLAIVLGMLVGNTVYPRMGAWAGPGVNFAKNTLLRLGIILYGLRLTFQDIGHVGLGGVLIDALVVCTTFGLACWLGTRVFGIDRKTAILIGAGSSICGAAAVLATEPVVRARAEQVAVAVATVVVFGTVAIFVYPSLYRLNLAHPVLPVSPTAYGLYAGSTIHEVAQVVAAGTAVDHDAADTAVIAKMVRVMMLAPFLVALSWWLTRTGAEATQAGARRGRVAIPWFALGFVAVAGINSLAILPAPLVELALELDMVLLAMAMGALGLTTHVSALRTAGVRPLGLAAMLFAWLMGGGLAINAAVGAWLP
jgi:uncharacterized integral membrane protein (TIGR00698 family)